MLFQTWAFAVFFAVVYLVYLLLRKTKFWLHWILVVSYVFYGWWNPLYLILIGYSTVVDYLIVRYMDRNSRSKAMISVTIINNLFLLGFFKYGNFIVENVNALLSMLKVEYTLPSLGLLFPVGLSFFVFKSIGYAIDFYRGDIEREKNFIRYAVFVSFFPILIAGPIERARNLLPQLKNKPKLSKEDVCGGLSLLLMGLFKKLAMADLLSIYVDEVYGMPDMYASPALLLATFAFAWQIYFDFSGYTDMARGIGRMMGFRIMLNFDNPYLASSLGDFWRRWHISLSTWFRDYVYIPLGGNRKGQFGTYKNLFITMVASGLWHGSAWTFVIWGALHGVGASMTRAFERSLFYKEKVPKIAKQIFVFIFVSFAWIFFRAESFSSACLIVKRIFTAGFENPVFPIFPLILIFAIWIYQFAYESKLKKMLETSFVKIAVAVFMILYLCVCASSSGQAFIYTQF